jgi:hypothetical protein
VRLTTHIHTVPKSHLVPGCVDRFGQKTVTHKKIDTKICNEGKSHLFHLIANKILMRRKVNILKMVARILSDGIACKGAGLIVCGVVPRLSCMSSWCAQGQLNVILIRLY